MSKNETFGSIKVYAMTTNNQPLNSILQITNFSGQAHFTRDMICTELRSISLDAQNGSMKNLLGTKIDLSGMSVTNTVRITDVSGTLTGPYMNMSEISNKGSYFYESRGSLEIQNTTGLIAAGNLVNSRTIDTITNISAWQQILAPTDSVPEASSDLSGLIVSVNQLLQMYANKGIILTTESTIPTITGITVDISGFYVNWTPTTARALSIDGIVYDSSAKSPYFIPIATTNQFYYSLTVGPSLPFLAAFCTINGNPTDLGNYYPTFGLAPSTLAYYRATSPGMNYIILSTETKPLTGNTVFFIKGSNASPTRPISFIYYNKSIYGAAYVSANITLTDPSSKILTYNFALGSWSLR